MMCPALKLCVFIIILSTIIMNNGNTGIASQDFSIFKFKKLMPTTDYQQEQMRKLLKWRKFCLKQCILRAIFLYLNKQGICH